MSLETTLNGNRKRTAGLFTAAVLMAGVTGAASAISYPGPFTGDTVVFSDVEETSLTDPGTALYGEPVTPPPAIDDLVFEPTTDFGAFAPNGAATGDLTDGRLVFTLTADQGLFLDTISVSEGGQFLTTGTGSVNAAGTIRLRDVNTSLPIGSAVEFDFTELPATNDEGGNWTGSGSIDLSSAQLNSVEVIIENTLAASIGAENGSAFIDKKNFDVNATTFVPEPGSLALLGLGMLALLSRRRGDEI